MKHKQKRRTIIIHIDGTGRLIMVENLPDDWDYKIMNGYEIVKKCKHPKRADKNDCCPDCGLHITRWQV